MEEYTCMPFTDIKTFHDLVDLYGFWLERAIYNCNNSGFGQSPPEGGVTCNSHNSHDTFKCRMQLEFPEQWEKYVIVN
jgi:hypothetical protein